MVPDQQTRIAFQNRKEKNLTAVSLQAKQPKREREMEQMNHQDKHPGSSHPDKQSSGNQQHSHDHDKMIIEMRSKWLWTNITVITLGIWLFSSPFTFGAGRDATLWNDVICGLLLVVLGSLSLIPRYDFYGRWGAAFIGGWLQFAPLVLWAPNPATYLNDTFVGAWVIALTILVPMMPGMAHHMEMKKPGPIVPPGWSYNPSSWHQRAPLILTGFVGWFISRYLAAVQLGYIDSAWEPFFGEGTSRVLHSKISKMWPISDAGLGAFAYTIEALMAWMGGVQRWRTMPWMVTFFGILVIPLGITHIVLVILQPVAVGYWCTMCLAAALVMLIMIPLTVDEVVAMCQFMVKSVRSGKPFWRTFWVGGTMDEVNEDSRTPKYGEASFQKMIPPTVWGVSLPWTLIISAVLGLWIIFSPPLFGSDGKAADSSRLIGALIVTVSVIATAEVIRSFRFLNVLGGIWLAAAPWLLSGFSPGAKWNEIIVGIVIVLFAIPRGKIREQYGTWDRFIK